MSLKIFKAIKSDKIRFSRYSKLNHAIMLSKMLINNYQQVPIQIKNLYYKASKSAWLLPQIYLFTAYVIFSLMFYL